MVAPPRQWRADARLLPRRGYPGSPLLALSPRALRRTAPHALVYPRGLRMNDTPATCPETRLADLVAAPNHSFLGGASPPADQSSAAPSPGLPRTRNTPPNRRD